MKLNYLRNSLIIGTMALSSIGCQNLDYSRLMKIQNNIIEPTYSYLRQKQEEKIESRIQLAESNK